jgi:hypothetical protein
MIFAVARDPQGVIRTICEDRRNGATRWRMNFLRDPQDQVLEKWFARRDQRDVVAKLDTGGGKTVVGILIAKSSLAEGKGLVAMRPVVGRLVASLGLTASDFTSRYTSSALRDS